jgi:hypothetical protein
VKPVAEPVDAPENPGERASTAERWLRSELCLHVHFALASSSMEERTSDWCSRFQRRALARPDIALPEDSAEIIEREVDASFHDHDLNEEGLAVIRLGECRETPQRGAPRIADFRLIPADQCDLRPRRDARAASGRFAWDRRAMRVRRPLRHAPALDERSRRVVAGPRRSLYDPSDHRLELQGQLGDLVPAEDLAIGWGSLPFDLSLEGDRCAVRIERGSPLRFEHAAVIEAPYEPRSPSHQPIGAGV